MSTSRFFTTQDDSIAQRGKGWDSDIESRGEREDELEDELEDEGGEEDTLLLQPTLVLEPTQEPTLIIQPTQPTQRIATQKIIPPTQKLQKTQLINQQEEDDILSSSPPATIVPTQPLDHSVVQVAASSPVKTSSTVTTPMRLPYSKAPGANNNIPSSPSSISEFKASETLSTFRPFKQPPLSGLSRSKFELSNDQELSTTTPTPTQEDELTQSSNPTAMGSIKASTQPKVSPTIDLTAADAEVPYVVSSDDEQEAARDTIGASTFYKSASSSREESIASAAINPVTRMKQLSKRYAYNGASNGQLSQKSRPTSSNQPAHIARKKVAQRAPQPAQTANYDLSKLPSVVRDIAYGLRNSYPNFPANILLEALNNGKGNENQAKIILRRLDEIAVRVRYTLPQYPEELVYRIVGEKKNFDDACNHLLAMGDEKEQDDDVVEVEKPEGFADKSAKRNVRRVKQTIAEKFSHQRRESPPSSPPPSSPGLEIVAEAPVPARRRLIKGSDLSRSTSKTSTPKPSSPAEARSSPSITDSEESGKEDEEGDAVLEWEVVKLINESDLPKLQDLAPSISKEDLGIIMENRPFRSLYELEEFVVSTKKGTKSGKKRLGERVANSVTETYRGLRAVDTVVEICLKMSEKARGIITSWGGNIHNGELRIVDVPSDETIAGRQMDSGIGTPSNSGDTSLRNSVLSSDPAEADLQITSVRRKVHNFIRTQPSSIVEGIQLKDYQMVGFNWLYLLYKEGLSCILADEMGLGKTFQIISFLAYLKEQNIPGPHLVVVPATTLENWLREFKRFCPNVHVEPYHGSAKERVWLRENLQSNPNFDVLVTTYSMAQGGEGRDAKADTGFLKSFRWNVGVFDEGHMLKNSTSARYKQIAKIRAKHRILLTGTPIQNNLQELVSLLAFLYPKVFSEHQEDLGAVFKYKATTSASNQSNSALLSQQRINKARNMTGIVILRRRKADVLKSLPPKIKEIQYCEMTPSQKKLYAEQEAAVKKMILDRQSGVTGQKETQSNALMMFRKAALHPLLFRRLYTDDTIQKMTTALCKDPIFNENRDRNPDYVREDLEVMTDYELNRFCREESRIIGKYALKDDEWMDAGKVEKLKQILRNAQRDGDRVLIFSQFVMCLNVLESVMDTLDVPYLRMDGSTNVQLRQDLIDQFYNETDITAFLLSTKAGGFGINLACANVVVIFDCSFNPTDDLQSEDRAHRVGQTRPVKVIRLISRGTVEESILSLANTKMELDKNLSGGVGSTSGEVVEEPSEQDGELTAAKGEDLVFNALKSKLLSTEVEEDNAIVEIEEEANGKHDITVDSKGDSTMSDKENGKTDKKNKITEEEEDENLLTASSAGGRRARATRSTRNSRATSEVDSDTSQASKGSKRKLSDEDAPAVEEVSARGSKLRKRNPPSSTSSSQSTVKPSSSQKKSSSATSSQKSSSSQKSKSKSSSSSSSQKNGDIKSYFK